jgi:hypothetical protein
MSGPTTPSGDHDRASRHTDEGQEASHTRVARDHIQIQRVGGDVTITHAPPRSRPYSRAIAALAVCIVAWTLPHAPSDGDGRPEPHEAVPPRPDRSTTPTPSRNTSGRPARPPVPSAECQWQGDSQCQATAKVNPTDSTAKCTGSGGQGSGNCSVHVK